MRYCRIRALLGVGSDKEGSNNHNLLVDANISLSDKDTSEVDGLGDVHIENLGLKSTLLDFLLVKHQDNFTGDLSIACKTKIIDKDDFLGKS